MSVFMLGGTMLTTRPSGGSIGEKLLLPNGNAVLDFVYDVTASVKGFAAMDGGDANPDGDGGQVERTHPMNGPNLVDRKVFAGLCENAFGFKVCEFGVGLVLKS